MRLGDISVVPVESWRTERAPRIAPKPAPAAGRCWGVASRFGLIETPEDRAAREGGGTTIRWPTRYKRTVRVRNFSPVWRRFEDWKLNAVGSSLEWRVRVTREALFPVGEDRLRYLGPLTGYVEDAGSRVYEERIIHTYVLLSIPPPAIDGVKVTEGTEGAWPEHPEDDWYSSIGGSLSEGGSPLDSVDRTR